ncbi:MAG: ribose transport system permease protein, partial [Verrucomicrobiota bacterium]
MKAASPFETAREFASRSSPFIGLVVVFLIGALISPVFLTLENLANFARTASIMGFVAIGMTFVILCGSIDLSVSSVFSLSGFLFILFSKYSIALAICVPLTAGLVVGLFNGVLIAWLSIPSFVATLATMIFLRGLVLVVTNETTFRVAGFSGVLSFLGRGMIFKYISF